MEILRGFRRLGDLTNQIDRQKTVAEIRPVHPDMVGKLEPMLERPAGNAAMQIAVLGCLLLLAGDGQQIGLEGDVEIVLRRSPPQQSRSGSCHRRS